MIPTIDIGVTAVLTAIGGFLSWAVSAFFRFLNFAHDRIKLIVVGTRFGRIVLEYTLFGVILAAWGLFISHLLQVVGGYLFRAITPLPFIEAYNFLSIYLPLSNISGVILYGFTLYLLTLNVRGIYSVYRRTVFNLRNLLRAGKY